MIVSKSVMYVLSISYEHISTSLEVEPRTKHRTFIVGDITMNKDVRNYARGRFGCRYSIKLVLE